MEKAHVKLAQYFKLVEYIFNSKKPDVNFSIARVMLRKISEFPDVTIEEIAYLAHTSPSSVTKFCRKLGYNSFRELRTDTQEYEYANLFQDMQNIAERRGLDAAVNYYIRENKKKQEEMYEIYEHGQIRRIAQMLKNSRSGAVLSGLHGFAAANSFMEYASYYNIPVFEMNRDAADDMIQNILETEDIIFVISLSGRWVKERMVRLNITPEIAEKVVLITYVDMEQYQEMFKEIVSVKDLEEFFEWNCYSSNTLQMFFSACNYLFSNNYRLEPEADASGFCLFFTKLFSIFGKRKRLLICSGMRYDNYKLNASALVADLF